MAKTPVSQLLGMYQSGGRDALRQALAERVSDLHAMDMAGRLGGLQPMGGGDPTPQPQTVADIAQVAGALTTMATGAATLSQKEAELSQGRATAAEQRAKETVEAAERRAKEAADRATAEGNKALELFREAMNDQAKLRAELEEARRQADADRDAAERQRLADRLDRIEERYEEDKARLQSQLDQANARANDLQQQLTAKKSALEEIIEALKGGEPENAAVVRLVRALVPGEQPSLLGPDGLPLDPDQRYRHLMAEELANDYAEGRKTKKELLNMAKGLYNDIKSVLTGRTEGSGISADDIRALLAEQAGNGAA